MQVSAFTASQHAVEVDTATRLQAEQSWSTAQAVLDPATRLHAYKPSGAAVRGMHLVCYTAPTPSAGQQRTSHRKTLTARTAVFQIGDSLIENNTFLPFYPGARAKQDEKSFFQSKPPALNPWTAKPRGVSVATRIPPTRCVTPRTEKLIR
jgi:hypothetical protein